MVNSVEFATDDNYIEASVTEKGITDGSSSYLNSTFEGSTTLSDGRPGSINKSNDTKSNVKIAEEEEKNVLRSRLLVISVLTVALAAMTIGTYIYLSRLEIYTFKSEFKSYASEIVQVSQQNAKNTLESIKSFSDSISAQAAASSQSWPFVTIKDFDAIGSQLNSITKAYGVYFLPLVEYENKQEWEMYTASNFHNVLREIKDYRNNNDTSLEQVRMFNMSDPLYTPAFFPFIYTMDITTNITNYTTFGADQTVGPYLPIWQASDIVNDIPWYAGIMNWNALSSDDVRNAYYTAKTTKQTALSFYYWNSTLLAHHITPIFEKNTKDRRDQKIVGFVWLVVNFLEYYQNIIPKEGAGVNVVLEGRCADSITYQQTYNINGLQAELKGFGDLHETKYNADNVTADFLRFDIDDDIKIPEDFCFSEMVMHLYPSDQFKEQYLSNKKYIYTATVALIFLFTSLVFVIYDCTVRRRQEKVMDRIIRQHKIVSDVFPAQYRDRMYESNGKNAVGDRRNSKNHLNNKEGISLSSGAGADGDFTTLMADQSKPMADLFPSATIIFSDISGFTAWSSTREPSQVFTLLETIYGAFDQIAYRHNIFKVETVGDCYVAVCGLPEPRENHAVPIARFARDCMCAMVSLTQKLEITLGPDTTDLAMRMGIHSGQVTAGVLRGERSRFQLFGDTVNVAARMESTGESNRIHISDTTAAMLRKYGKSKWIWTRKDKVLVKGKGQLQTFWLETKKETQHRKFKQCNSAKKLNMMAPVAEADSSKLEQDNQFMEDEEISKEYQHWRQDDDSQRHWDDEADDTNSWENVDVGIYKEEFLTRTQRLIEWNVDVLSALLKQVVSSRANSSTKKTFLSSSPASCLEDIERRIGQGRTVLEEFKDIIKLPKISEKELQKRKQPNAIKLEDTVIPQLRDYITRIAHMYRNNYFHNFEHASHVTSSVRKLLTRIVNVNKPMNLDNKSVGKEKQQQLSSQEPDVDLSGHSYGITSDPLTQFAVVLSAVIHDADHPGVPNTQLVAEKVPIAVQYDEKSVAEQNSVSLAWKLLMQPQYKELRRCIYSNEDELTRFRQLVVNTVMATDICDKELGAQRKARWAIAFADNSRKNDNTNNENNQEVSASPLQQREDNQISVNRKATIVIEHLIQASDVSHTMQHWQVYKKWNERFFQECYAAYMNGRAASDPSVGWYKGEIGFFDFYVIPLAKKLENCGVFGVSSHEYLAYAQSNREEWVMEGKELVEEYKKNYKIIAAREQQQQQQQQQQQNADSSSSSSGEEFQFSYDEKTEMMTDESQSSAFSNVDLSTSMGIF